MISSIAMTLIIILSFAAFLPLDSILSDSGGKDWMAKIDDAANISHLSIPGSHDSGALHSIADVSGKCQTLSVGAQLNIGVRFLDIRLRLVNDELTVVHSFVDQKLDFCDVLYDIEEFLAENESEFIILSIKEDDGSKDSTMSFAEAVKEELMLIENAVNFDTSLPKTVGEARGRVHILSRFNSDFGIPAYYGWEDDATFTLGEFLIQDNYCITDVSEKIDDVKKTAEAAKKGGYELVLNFTSCYLDGAFPPTYSGTAARKINPEILDFIKDGSGTLGVVISDYVNEELVRAIYERSYE
jgi:1-phosphatidylinositol phosphodiesterase